MARIYTLVNQKGGVGKTTCAINLAAYLGYFGQRVLLVDLDPQANATSSVGLDKRAIKIGTYEVLIGSAPIVPQIWHSPRFKLSRPALFAGPGRRRNRADRNEPARISPARRAGAGADRYDYILIDCPPSLSLLTINGLVAAQNGVIIPVQCEYLALEGLGQLTQTVNRVRSSFFPELKVRGVVLTMFDGRTLLARDVVSEVRSFFPNLVFNTIIPRSIRLAEAPSCGQPISVYAPESNAAKTYESLAREILDQDGIHIPVLQAIKRRYGA